MFEYVRKVLIIALMLTAAVCAQAKAEKYCDNSRVYLASVGLQQDTYSAEEAISVKKNGKVLNRLENGFITAEFYADSNSVESGKAVTLVTAYYREGKLLEVACDTETSVYDNPRLLSAGVNVTDSSFGSFVRAFVFESIKSIHPLKYEPRMIGGWGISGSPETDMAIKCVYLMNTVSPYMFKYKLPETAVADNLSDGIHTSEINGVVFDEYGAGGNGGSLVYEISSRNVWIAADKRTEAPGFKTEFSADGCEYAEILPAEKADFEFDSRQYSIYRFSGFPSDKGWLRVTFGEEELHLRSVLANIDFSDDRLVHTVKSYFEDGRSGNSVSAEAMESYKEAVLKNITAGYTPGGFAGTMQTDGSWTDIDYGSSRAYVHMRRCKNIALEIYSGQDDGSLDSLSKALDYYFNQKISYGNDWYTNHITVPQEVSEILLLSGRLLPSQTESKVRSYLENKRNYLNSVYTFTGSNELEISQWMINLALYTKDVQNMQLSLNRIESELMMVTKLGSEYSERRVYLNGIYSGLPGIQTDYSGLFHESQLYSGGYCMTLVKKVSVLLADARECGLMDGVYLEDYVDHILEHYRWIFYKRQMDFNTVGRNIAQMTTDENGKMLSSSATNLNGASMKQTLSRLADIEGIYRSEELKAFARLWSSLLSTTSYTEGNRYFYKPYYMVNQKGNYMAGLRMSSDRVNGSEQVSWCNLKGKYMTDGCLFVYRTTEEFNDIFAAWDWNKIPGTTSFSDKEIVFSENQDYKTPGSASKLAGGVSDGVHGAAAMQLVREGLSAKKAWFMFDKEIVCLGSDISNTTGYNAVTTVNQCITEDAPVIFDGKDEVILENNRTYEASDVGFILNDGIGYVFVGDGKVMAEVGDKTGDRYDINFQGSSERPDKSNPVTKRIFSLWLDHTDNNLYSYIIVPDTEKDELYRYLGEGSPVQIIENSRAVMAVRHKELRKTQYIFWERGKCGWIEASAPCIVSVEETGGGYRVSVAALSYEEKSLTISFDRELYGSGAVYMDGKITVKASLPQGEFAGETVEIKLSERKGVD